MELAILHGLEALHCTVLNYIMYVFTLLGDKGIFWIVIGILMLFVLPKQYRKVGLSVAIALILSVIICNLVLKNAFQRDRPFWTDPTFENLFNYFDTIDDWSFPSGHTSASFAAAVAIRMWKKREGIIAIIIAALIAFSRLYLCVHYPTDVLISLGLGIGCGLAGYYLGKLILNKSVRFRAVFKANQSYAVLFKGVNYDMLCEQPVLVEQGVKPGFFGYSDKNSNRENKNTIEHDSDAGTIKNKHKNRSAEDDYEMFASEDEDNKKRDSFLRTGKGNEKNKSAGDAGDDYEMFAPGDEDTKKHSLVLRNGKRKEKSEKKNKENNKSGRNDHEIYMQEEDIEDIIEKNTEKIIEKITEKDTKKRSSVFNIGKSGNRNKALDSGKGDNVFSSAGEKAKKYISSIKGRN